MVERNTRVRASQIVSVLPDDLEATNSPVDQYVPEYDSATQKFTWIAQTGGGASALADLIDVEFDSGTPTDNQVLTYDDNSGKWKAEDLSIKSYKTTFVNSNLSNNKITITHNLGIEYPIVMLYDGDDEVMWPSGIKYVTTNSVELDFTGITPITGTYKIRVMG